MPPSSPSSRTARAGWPLTAAAISSWSTSNASRRTNTARSVGDEVSGTSIIAIDTPSASSTSSATSGAAGTGSGSHGPTYDSLRRDIARSRSSDCRVVIRTRKRAVVAHLRQVEPSISHATVKSRLRWARKASVARTPAWRVVRLLLRSPVRRPRDTDRPSAVTPHDPDHRAGLTRPSVRRPPDRVRGSAVTGRPPRRTGTRSSPRPAWSAGGWPRPVRCPSRAFTPPGRTAHAHR